MFAYLHRSDGGGDGTKCVRSAMDFGWKLKNYPSIVHAKRNGKMCIFYENSHAKRLFHGNWKIHLNKREYVFRSGTLKGSSTPIRYANIARLMQSHSQSTLSQFSIIHSPRTDWNFNQVCGGCSRWKVYFNRNHYGVHMHTNWYPLKWIETVHCKQCIRLYRRRLLWALSIELVIRTHVVLECERVIRLR